METLLKCIRIYGWWKGSILAFQLKIFNASQLSIPGLQQKLKIRPGTIDTYSVDEIFLQQVYNIDWPKEWPAPLAIIDAGANIGCTSLAFANRFPSASIVALEPEAENFKLLQHNSSFYPKIEILQAAVWDKDAFIQVVDAGFGNRGFVVKECAETDPNSTKAFSISSLIQRFPSGKIDILKIDIEGSEKEVFAQGFESWLPNCSCVIVELHDRMKEGCSQAVFNAFSNYNFSCEIKGGNLVFYNRDFD